MDTITITEEQFMECSHKAMREYTDKMKSDNDHKYDTLSELSDVLTMATAFALLKRNLFERG